MNDRRNEPIDNIDRRNVLRVLSSAGLSATTETPANTLDALAKSEIFPSASQSPGRFLPIAQRVMIKVPQMVADCLSFQDSIGSRVSINNFIQHFCAPDKDNTLVQYAGKAAVNWESDRKELFENFRRLNIERNSLMSHPGWSGLCEMLHRHWSQSRDSFIQETIELICRLPRDIAGIEDEALLLDQFVSSVKTGSMRFESRSEYRQLELVSQIVDAWEDASSTSQEGGETFIGRYERWLNSVQHKESSLLKAIGLDSDTIDRFYAGMDKHSFSSVLFSNKVGLLNLGQDGLLDVPLFSDEFERVFATCSRTLGQGYAEVRRKLGADDSAKGSDTAPHTDLEADRMLWFGAFINPAAWT